MRNWTIAFLISSTICIILFLFVLVLHYGSDGSEAEFWCNVCLSIFGSALLTSISSIIGYYYEKRRTLEGFSYSTRVLISFIKKYDVYWDNERKIDFFLDYDMMDKTKWDSQLGEIYFMVDKNQENFLYIYEKIYKPITELNSIIASHEFHFRLHKDGNGRNEEVMHQFISDIESLFIEKHTEEYENSDGMITTVTSPRNKLVKNVLDELNGRYYDLMYSKKAEKKEL